MYFCSDNCLLGTYSQKFNKIALNNHVRPDK